MIVTAAYMKHRIPVPYQTATDYLHETEREISRYRGYRVYYLKKLHNSHFRVKYESEVQKVLNHITDIMCMLDKRREKLIRDITHGA